MTFILQHILPLFTSSIAGFITYYAMQFIDDVLKWTANWPNPAKQGIVMFIGLLIPVLNSQYGLSLPVDPSQLLTQPGVQSVIAIVLAFFLKHASTPKAPVATPASVLASLNAAAPAGPAK